MNKQLDTVIVIKVGTSTLTKKDEAGNLSLDIESFRRIGTQVLDLKQQGYVVAIVSSAAITAGMVVTNLAKRPTNEEGSMPTLQGLASIGWRHILNAWDDALQGLIIGELLITRRELERDAERSELLKVTHNLLTNGHVVIVNENDALTHEEIAFGDNDTLAVAFASKLKQSHLFGDDISVIILSDIDGVYKDIHDSKTLIKKIEDVDTYLHVIRNTDGGVGTGGMTTKFSAAKIAKEHGIAMYITNGRTVDVLGRTLRKEVGTYFQ